MPPKKVSRANGNNKEEESYSYITDEEDEHVAAAPSTSAPAAPPSAVTGSEPPAGPPRVDAAVTRTVHRGPPCATSKAKARLPSPSTSSDDPGPVLPPRVRHNPEPPRTPSRSAERRMSPSLPREPEEGDKAHGQHRSPATRGKGKHRGHAPRRTQDCPHCWAPIAVTPRGSGLSQHMWWNLECIAHQIYVQGDTTWSQAVRQAQAVKERRESEWEWEEGPDAAPREPPAAPVLPARSARHRFLLEERRLAEKMEPELEEEKGSEHDHDAETKKKKKKKKRKTHRGGSDASREVDRSRRRRRPPSSDASDGGGHKAKRRGGDKSDLVWIQVSRASLKAN